MSRAINVSLSEEEVRTDCEKNNVSVTVIEPLLSGGTRVVCRTIEGADEMRRRFRGKIIEGAVKRSPFYQPKAPPRT